MWRISPASEGTHFLPIVASALLSLQPRHGKGLDVSSSITNAAMASESARKSWTGGAPSAAA